MFQNALNFWKRRTPAPEPEDIEEPAPEFGNLPEGIYDVSFENKEEDTESNETETEKINLLQSIASLNMEIPEFLESESTHSREEVNERITQVLVDELKKDKHPVSNDIPEADHSTPLEIEHSREEIIDENREVMIHEEQPVDEHDSEEYVKQEHVEIEEDEPSELASSQKIEKIERNKFSLTSFFLLSFIFTSISYIVLLLFRHKD